MTKEQEELRARMRENQELLNTIIRHEAAEQQAITQNLAEFHEALDARKKIINAALDEKRDKDFAELSAQIQRLKDAISNRPND